MNNLVFYIGLGVGLGLAAGLRPFLPALLAGGLASGKLLGVAFADGHFSFLQSGWWLVAMALCALVAYLAQFAMRSGLMDGGPPYWGMTTIAIATGALLFAGTLCDHGYAIWPGLLAGGAAALFGSLTVRPILTRARARLEDRVARDALTVYLDGTSLLLAALVALLHPLGYVALVLFAWLAWTGRGRGGGKYAGLRILGK